MLWDSIRKVLDLVEKITGGSGGWRKIKFIRRTAKNLFRVASQQVFRGGNKNPRITEQAVKNYLHCAKQIHERTQSVISTECTLMTLVLMQELQCYRQYLDKLIDRVERRLINGEEIPAAEKIFSILNRIRNGLKKANYIRMSS